MLFFTIFKKLIANNNTIEIILFRIRLLCLQKGKQKKGRKWDVGT